MPLFLSPRERCLNRNTTHHEQTVKYSWKVNCYSCQSWVCCWWCLSHVNKHICLWHWVKQILLLSRTGLSRNQKTTCSFVQTLQSWGWKVEHYDLSTHWLQVPTLFLFPTFDLGHLVKDIYWNGQGHLLNSY